MEGQPLQIKMDRTFSKENQQRLLVPATSDLTFTLENGTFITFFITYVGMYGNVEILEMFDQQTIKMLCFVKLMDMEGQPLQIKLDRTFSKENQ